MAQANYFPLQKAKHFLTKTITFKFEKQSYHFQQVKASQLRSINFIPRPAHSVAVDSSSLPKLFCPDTHDSKGKHLKIFFFLILRA